MNKSHNLVATKLVDSVLAGEFSTEIVNLSNLYQKDLLNAGYSDSEAAEISEAHLRNQVTKRLLKQNDEHKRTFGSDLLEVNGDRCRMLLLTRHETLDALQNLLPKNFEDFCVQLLKSLGAIAHNVGGPGDGGVDFQGKNLTLGGMTEFLPDFAKPALIGQAKRYKGKVSEPEVREFLGGAMLRAREMELGLCTPVIFAFWTTSRLDTAGLDLCKKYGVWYLDGRMLVKFAESQKIDLRDFS